MKMPWSAFECFEGYGAYIKKRAKLTKLQIVARDRYHLASQKQGYCSRPIVLLSGCRLVLLSVVAVSVSGGCSHLAYKTYCLLLLIKKLLTFKLLISPCGLLVIISINEAVWWQKHFHCRYKACIFSIFANQGRHFCLRTLHALLYILFCIFLTIHVLLWPYREWKFVLPRIWSAPHWTLQIIIWGSRIDNMRKSKFCLSLSGHGPLTLTKRHRTFPKPNCAST